MWSACLLACRRVNFHAASCRPFNKSRRSTMERLCRLLPSCTSLGLASCLARKFHYASGGDTKYCDERVCLDVCPLRISKTTNSDISYLTNFRCPWLGLFSHDNAVRYVLPVSVSDVTVARVYRIKRMLKVNHNRAAAE